MIIIRLQGGLGNQLFQYALYLQLERSGRAVKIDEAGGFVNDLQRRPCLGESLGVSYEIATDREVRSLRDAFMDPVSRLRRKLAGRKNKEWEEPDGRFYPEVLTMEDVYLDGYFQSEKYFPDPAVRRRLAQVFEENIAKRVRAVNPAGAKDLTLKYNTGVSPQPTGGPQGFFAAMSAGITADGDRSVSLHIRRGDYLLPGTSETHGGICTERYYERALAAIREAVPEAVFYVFSDDLSYAADWAKRQQAAGRGEFRLVTDSGGTEEVLPEDGYRAVSDAPFRGKAGRSPMEASTERDMENLLLMRLCRHHILANSSFSWWGAWSDEAADSLVLVPDRWFNNRAADGIYTAQMERIPCI